MVLAYLYLACLLFSALMAFLNRRHLKSRQLIIFIPYLFYLFIQEFTLLVVIKNFYPVKSTGIIYNIYKPISALCFTVFFYRIPFNASLRKLILALITIYLLVTFFTFGFIQPVTIYNSYLSLAGGLVIASCALFFLFNYFNLDNPELEKHWRPVIWICIGILLFYPVVNISFSFYHDLISAQAKILGAKLYQTIPRVMSIFMYSCFSYAFYLCKKKN